MVSITTGWLHMLNVCISFVTLSCVIISDMFLSRCHSNRRTKYDNVFFYFHFICHKHSEYYFYSISVIVLKICWFSKSVICMLYFCQIRIGGAEGFFQHPSDLKLSNTVKPNKSSFLFFFKIKMINQWSTRLTY